MWHLERVEGRPCVPLCWLVGRQFGRQQACAIRRWSVLYMSRDVAAGAAAWLGGLAAALARHAESGHRQDVQSLERDWRGAAFTGSVGAAVEPL